MVGLVIADIWMTDEGNGCEGGRKWRRRISDRKVDIGF
jgi:hypothetical protein